MIRVVHIGLGPIGTAVLKQTVTRADLRSVGAVDIDPAKFGRDLGEVGDLGRRMGIKVSDDLVRTIRVAKPDIAILCTSSSLVRLMPQLELVLKTKTPIVSTTEELAYPSRTHRRQAQLVDRWAQKAKVAVLATGVNPGFAMDVLPIVLTAACERVDRIVVRRVQDARIRRLPFQQKIGAGLTTAQFQQAVNKGLVRHVGLTESIAMVADAVGWRLDRITDEIEPKLTSDAVTSEFFAVDAGYVSGIVQEGVGYLKGTAVIRLRLEAYLGAPETFDSVEIEGVPPLSMRIDGGIHGDIATVALVINSIPRVLNTSPGLHTMRDLPLPSYFPGPRRTERRSRA